MNSLNPLFVEFPPQQYRLVLAPRAHIARHVRRIVAILLELWGLPGLIDAAELAVTEVLSNVVRHAPGGPCRVVISRRNADVGGGLRVEVWDGSPKLPEIRLQEPAYALEENGRGLALLTMITDAWGAEPDADGRGKTVWFELMPCVSPE
jgi:anti-sigma regulatory factor (Ser/Thr protein kinase)